MDLREFKAFPSWLLLLVFLGGFAAPLFGQGIAFSLATDYGTFYPDPAGNGTLHTPAFQSPGGLVALKAVCWGCQPDHFPVTSVSWGNSVFLPAAQVTVNGYGTTAVWTLASAPAGSFSFLVSTDNTARLDLQAYTAGGAITSVAVTTNVVYLGNSPTSTTVTTLAGDFLVAFSNSTDPYSCPSGNVRAIGICDQVGSAGTSVVQTQVNFQGNSFGNGIVILTLRSAPPLTVTTVKTTPTQAVLSWVAPDSSPCTVAVSESGTLVPLVHDVDVALFPGSNTDARAGAVFSGRSRIFVAGTRDTETGKDGVNYSRALQQNTKHWYSVTCGSVTASGVFVTAVAPLGNTYRDLPYVTNGSLVIPTVTDDIAQTIVEPHTGTLLKKVNNSAQTRHRDNGQPDQIHLYSGGETKMCSLVPSGPKNGFLCAFNADFGQLFYISPDGSSVALGIVWVFGATGPNGWPVVGARSLPYISADGHFYVLTNDNSGHEIVVKGTYAGDYSAQSPQNPAAINWQNITPFPNDLTSQAAVFAPSFNWSNYGFGDINQVGAHWGVVGFRRGQQDTAGWYMAIDLAAGTIVGMLNAETGPATSGCGLHQGTTQADQPIVGLGFHSNWGGGGPWSGPWGWGNLNALDTVQTVIQVASTVAVEPDGLSLGTPPVGAILRFGGGEPVKVTAVTPTSFTVQRNYIPPLIWPWDSASNHQASAHAIGEGLGWQCSDWNYGGGGGMYWKFLDDPHANGPGIVYEIGTGIGGHNDMSNTNAISEGWLWRTGPLATTIGTPITATIPVSPHFANSAGECDSEACSQHVAYHTVGASYFTDGLPWNGVGIGSGVTNVSGQLYKYPFPYGSQDWPFALRDIHRKQVPTQATTGGTPLKDVSGPGSILSDQASDSYKYCVANVAGECRQGSAKGDMFANIPGTLNKLGCWGSDNPMSWINDLCITDFPSFGNAMVQIGFVPNHEGLGLLPGQPDTFDSTILGAGYSRVISEGLGGPKQTGEELKTLPDGSWGMFELYNLPYMMMAKMPPFVKDSVHRDYFVRSPLTLTPPAGSGATSAVVEFWYQETGNGFCVSRNEACVVTSQVVDDTNPFSWKTTDSWSPAPCPNTCTITLPVEPSHVAYYHVRWMSAAGVQVAEDFGVTAENAPIALSQVH